jgi:hypothetical protein
VRLNRPAAFACLVLCMTTGFSVISHASRQSKDSGPAQVPELKKLDAWSGRWNTQGKLFDTPYSHAGNITIAMTCGWSAYNGYMICDHLFEGPSGKHNDIGVYTYSPADKVYKNCSLDQTGAPHCVPVKIEGDVWTYDSEMEKDNKKIYIRTINDFSKPDLVTWNTKFSADREHWTLMNEGVDTKVR